MRIDSEGWCVDAHHLPSPNADTRPSSVVVDLLVIHCISLPPGVFRGRWIDALFANRLDCDEHPYFAGLRDLKVSCHVLVRRDGMLTQYVSLRERAWHAGVSAWEGRPRCNDYSIGIELEGAENTAYTNDQYARLAALTRDIMTAFPAITPDRVVAHSDIAPGRKTDPGPSFDWSRYRRLMAAAGRSAG